MELFYWLFLLMSFLSVSVSLNQFVTNRQVCSMTKIDVQRVRQDNSQWTTTWGWIEGAEVQRRLKAVVLFPHIRGCLEIQTGLVIWPQHYQSLFWFLRHIRISQHAHREKESERERESQCNDAGDKKEMETGGRRTDNMQKHGEIDDRGGLKSRGNRETGHKKNT